LTGAHNVIVPSDNSLLTIEDSDPVNSLSVIWKIGPLDQEEIRPCTELNASGGPVCRF
jgi:hypothetical protein